MLVWLKHVLDACPCTALGSWHQAVMLGPMRSRQPQGTSSLATLPFCCPILHAYMGTAFSLTQCVSIDGPPDAAACFWSAVNPAGDRAVGKPFSVTKQLNET